jgi:hypothetical protein
MQDKEVVQHVWGLGLGEYGHNLCGTQPELALCLGGVPDISCVLGAQRGAHPDDRVHDEATTGLDYHVELLLLLEHDHFVEDIHVVVVRHIGKART